MSYLGISLIIGLISLDTTIAFQILISQPLFACPLLGWLLGHPQLGFEMGIILQLLWIGILPVGAVTFPEGNVASMIMTVLVIQFHQSPLPHFIFTVALLIAILVSFVGERLTVLDRKINGYLFESVLQAAEQARVHRIALLNLISILGYFFFMSAFAFLMLNISHWLLNTLVVQLHPQVDHWFRFVRPAVLGLGLAFTIRLFYQWRPQKQGHS